MLPRPAGTTLQVYGKDGASGSYTTMKVSPSTILSGTVAPMVASIRASIQTHDRSYAVYLGIPLRQNSRSLCSTRRASLKG